MRPLLFFWALCLLLAGAGVIAPKFAGAEAVNEREGLLSSMRRLADWLFLLALWLILRTFSVPLHLLDTPSTRRLVSALRSAYEAARAVGSSEAAAPVKEEIEDASRTDQRE